MRSGNTTICNKDGPEGQFYGSYPAREERINPYKQGIWKMQTYKFRGREWLNVSDPRHLDISKYLDIGVLFNSFKFLVQGWVS